MPTYGMGKVIREMRIRLGYTQEELAYGICTAGTLSKIENGKSVISKRVFEALCSRMPGMHHVWVAFDTKQEMQRSKLCKQILLYLEAARLSEAKAAMERYQKLKENDNPFCRQFELYTQAIYQEILGQDEPEILPKLKEALKVTMPDYRKRFHFRKKEVLFTYDELYILSNMGIACVRNGDTETAYQIFAYLNRYIKRQDLDLDDSVRVCPMIYGNMAWILELQGRFDEAVKQCDISIEICIFAGKFTILPHLLCIKSRCLTASQHSETAKKSRRQAEAIFDIMRNYGKYGSFQEFYKACEPIYISF